MAIYKDESGKVITEKAFMKGKSERAAAQATEARAQLESSELKEEDFIAAERRVEHLERHAKFYGDRHEKLNGATTAAKPKMPAKDKGAKS